MSKKIIFSVAVVLLLSTGTSAMIIVINPPTGSVLQNQLFSIGDVGTNAGLSSIVSLSHGGSSASSSHEVAIYNKNVAGLPGGLPIGIGLGIGCFDGCSTVGVQVQEVGIEQNVGAGGSCAIVSASAFLDAGGNQEQFIGSSTSTKMQGQTLGLAAQEVVFRSDGGGGGHATNDATLEQTQVGVNSAGKVIESSTIELLQESCVGGAPTSTATAASSAVVTTSQNQTVFYTPPVVP